MGDNIVKLVFQAGASGFNTVIGQTQTLQGKIGKLAQGATILGSAFGQVGGAIGRAFGMFLQGGIWGAAAECIKLLIEKTGILKKTAETTAKTYESIAGQITKGYDEAVAKIDKICKSKNNELDVNQKLLESEIRLKRARGEISAEDAEAEVASSRSKTTAAKAANTVRLGEDAQNVRKMYLEKMKGELSNLGNILASYEKQATDKMAVQRQKFATESHIEVMNKRGSEELAPSFIEEAVRRKTDKKMAQWMKENGESELYDKEITSLVKSIDETYKGIGLIENAIKEAEAERALTEAAKAEIERLRESKKVGGESRSTKDESNPLSTSTSSLLSSARSAYASQFEQSFDLWRDPAAAQEAQNAAKAKDEHLSR